MFFPTYRYDFKFFANLYNINLTISPEVHMIFRELTRINSIVLLVLFCCIFYQNLKISRKNILTNVSL